MRPARGEYRPEIDGLRAVAVGAVVLYHASPGRVPGGFVGVDVFFVISGYLITAGILSGLNEGGFSLADFYGARIRRIFPALIVVLTAMLIAGWFLLISADYRSIGRYAAGGAFFVSNFVSWNDAGYFNGNDATRPLLHLWSLGIEEQFYLLWPLLLVLGSRTGRYFRGMVATIAVASLAYCIWLTPDDPTAAYYSPLGRAWELMAGAIVASWPRYTLPSLVREIAPAAGMGLILAGCFLFDRSTPFPGYRALAPVLGAVLVVAAGPAPWLSRSVLAARPMILIGLISYPLYLWHWPLLSIAYIRGFDEWPDDCLKWGLVLIAFALATLTYHLIELPSRRRATVIQLLALMVGAGAAGMIVSASQFRSRPVDTDPRRAFVQYYKELHRNALKAAYLSQCAFYDWDSSKPKASISSDCTPSGATVFLWGDSHAQAISLGIRQFVPRVHFAQVATGACEPRLGLTGRLTLSRSCDVSNAYARAAIMRLHPTTVIVAQRAGHEKTDWHAMARWLRRQGVAQVILTGPLPEWRPSLPAVIARKLWGRDNRRVAAGLDRQAFATDRVLASRYGAARDVTFVSLIARLCTRAGCLATVPGGTMLMAVDDAHLSPEASIYVGRAILEPAVRDRSR